MRSRRELALTFALFAGLTAADLASKAWALSNLSAARDEPAPRLCEHDDEGRLKMQRRREGETVLIPDFLEFRYAENCGAAFGMLSNVSPVVRKAFFTFAAVAALVILVWTSLRARGGVLLKAGIPLIASGAVGNVFDRIRHGYVVDFIRFHIRDGFEWPTFNVADIAITVGVAFLLLDGLRPRAPESV